MVKFDSKSFTAGIIVGSLGLVSVFAGSNIFTAKESDVVLSFMGSVIDYDDPLMSITNEATGETKLYIPLRETLEEMGYLVNWSKTGNRDAVDFISYYNISIEYAGHLLTKDKPYEKYRPTVTVKGVETELIHIEESKLRNIYSKGYDEYTEFFNDEAALPLINLEDEIAIKFETAPTRFFISIFPISDMGNYLFRVSHSSINYIEQGPDEYKLNLVRSDADIALNPIHNTIEAYDEVVAAVHVRYTFGMNFAEGTYVNTPDYTDAVFFVKVKK